MPPLGQRVALDVLAKEGAERCEQHRRRVNGQG